MEFGLHVWTPTTFPAEDWQEDCLGIARVRGSNRWFRPPNVYEEEGRLAMGPPRQDPHEQH